MTLSARRLLVDHESSVGQRARERRHDLLLELFPAFEEFTVLDLGGSQSFWERSPIRPLRVVAVNVVAPPSEVDWYESHAGDACDPPTQVVARDYDLVFSNSTIEHVGDARRRRAFADVVRELAPRHWVQTPNKYFPVEPHWLVPGMQFMPTPMRAAFDRYWPLTHTRSSTWKRAVEHVRETQLIGRTEMETLFPDSELHEERMYGMVKSLTAVLK